MNNLLEQALVEQNPHWNALAYQHDLKRSHDPTALSDLDLEEIQIITGIRRCGKSTLLQTLINHLMQHHDPKTILYLNFDDPNYTELCNNSKSIYTLITTAEKITAQRIHYLFLDEVQNVMAWEKYVKSSYDSKRFAKIVVTGSNADLLKSDYANLLSGRYTETQIYPLAYHELLLNHGIDTPFKLIQQKATALRLLDTLLHFGGFPRMHLLTDDTKRRKLLKNYYETILLKDCIKNHNIRDPKTLTTLAYYLINHIASLYSYNSLSKAIGSNENTVKQFIHILQNSYFMEEITTFAYSLKKQIHAKKKTYCIDNGLVNAITFKFSHNYGKLFENLVYTELKKCHQQDIHFFNDHKECDFIIHQFDQPTAIQACYALNDENYQREVKGLQAAMLKLSISQGTLLSYDQEKQIADNINVLPFWKYFGFMGN